jgi:hypothetical protein
MPRVQVYLPDDLHRELKARKIKASELFQAAVQAEVERQEKLAELDKYIEELIAEVGEPSLADLAAAEKLLGIPIPDDLRRAG